MECKAVGAKLLLLFVCLFMIHTRTSTKGSVEVQGGGDNKAVFLFVGIMDCWHFCFFKHETVGESLLDHLCPPVLLKIVNRD